MSIWSTAIPLIAIMIVALAAFRSYKWMKEKKSGFPLKDERSLYIQGKSATTAIQVGSWYMILLNFYNMYRIEFQGLRELSSLPVINSTLIIMNLLYMILISYYNRQDTFQ
jgi:uncharacterized membrane protein